MAVVDELTQDDVDLLLQDAIAMEKIQCTDVALAATRVRGPGAKALHLDANVLIQCTNSRTQQHALSSRSVAPAAQTVHRKYRR